VKGKLVFEGVRLLNGTVTVIENRGTVPGKVGFFPANYHYGKGYSGVDFVTAMRGAVDRDKIFYGQLVSTYIRIRNGTWVKKDAAIAVAEAKRLSRKYKCRVTPKLWYHGQWWILE
jgi:hypothetical protein